MGKYSTVEDAENYAKGLSSILDSKLNISVDDSSYSPYLLSICLLTGKAQTVYFKSKKSAEVWCAVQAKVDCLERIVNAIDTGKSYLDFRYFEASKWWCVYVELDDYELGENVVSS